MKKFIKNNLRLIIIFIIGIVVSTTIVSAATILFASSDVNFSSNVIASKNVQDAIDEVYTSFNDGCFPGYDKGTVSGGTYTCTKKSTIPDQAIVFDSSDVVFDNSNGNLTSTNVADALDEIAAKVPYCKEGYTKTNEQSNSYNCKKTITITANNQTITYGSSISQNTNQVTVEGLETGHSLNSITLTGSTNNVPGGTITPSNAVIYDSGSNNITNTYTINYETGTLTINRKATAMSISPTSGTIYKGSSTTTTITTDGDGTKSCSSSNTEVATCSVLGNTVTINGVAAGSATITVSQAAGTNYAATSKTYSVTVNNPLAATYIKNNVSGLQNVAGAYRYVGANPNNYVWFNNEQWRIIGVYGDQLKIIRATPSTTSQKRQNGKSDGNVWSGSLMQSTYLYNTYWPTLNSTAQGMVNQSATWNVGVCDSGIAAANAYTCAQQTPWTGKIGLIASYEYLYAAENDGTCWTTGGLDYSSGCYQKDWLFSTVTNSGSSSAWTLSPDTAFSTTALNVNSNGSVKSGSVRDSNAASPVVYLKSTITITGGNGGSGQTNSYKLG